MNGTKIVQHLDFTHAIFRTSENSELGEHMSTLPTITLTGNQLFDLFCNSGLPEFAKYKLQYLDAKSQKARAALYTDALAFARLLNTGNSHELADMLVEDFMARL